MTTVFDVQAEVRKLAEENPDFVYSSGENSYANPICKNYEVDGEGNAIPGSGCIVGQAAQRLGLPVEEVEQRSDVFEFLAGLGLYEDSNSGEYKILDWLSVVQAEQDLGTKWSKAVEDADRDVEV